MKTIITILLLFFSSIFINAGIIYTNDSNTICVTDYPKDFPCTPSLLFKFDKEMGWNKITYVKANDTYYLTGNLQIGENNRTNTYFQLGSKSHPRECLVVKGDIFISPYWINGLDPGKKWWTLRMKKYVNRLTIGVEGDNKIKPSLKIDNSKGMGFTLIVGGTHKNKALGGQLCVYNAVICALQKVSGKLIGSVKNGNNKFIAFGSANYIKIINSTISDASFLATYGFSNDYGSIENTVFDNCSTAIPCSGINYLNNCTFKKCGSAIKGWSSNTKLVLNNCHFSDNIRNFHLRFNCHVECIDCEIGKSLKDNIIQRNSINKTGNSYSSKLFLKKHIIVKVLDKSGKPFPGAEIEIIPNIIGFGIKKQVYNTDKKGMTPGINSSAAILLTQKIASSEYQRTINYSIKVNGVNKLTNFIPARSWETITINL